MFESRAALAAFLTLGIYATASATPLEFDWPDGAQVVAESRDGLRLDVFIDLPEAVAREGLDEATLEAISVGLINDAEARGDLVHSAMVWAVDPDDLEAGWQPLTTLARETTWVPRRPPSAALAGAPPVIRGAGAPGVTTGALSGKVVYVSQGHGFTWTPALGRWATQRGNTHGIVEDLVNAEAINHYLIPMLENAGAQVFTVRERDMQREMVIVDAEPGGLSSVEGAGAHLESGPWSDGAAAGFRAGMTPYPEHTSPFDGGGVRITETVAGEATAWTRWTPEIPVDGSYVVYVSYPQSASAAPDARYEIRHAGGTATVRVDQRRHGSTWVDLGAYWFRAGEDPERGAVVLYNDTEGSPGTTVAADALRFGGGVGDVARGDGDGQNDSPTSGFARWEESSRTYAQFAGAPSWVYDNSTSDPKDDVGTRARYAGWHHEPGEDAVFVSWHTNAPEGGRGTSTWVYGPNEPNGDYIFTGTEGSDALAAALHSEIVGDFRAAFDPEWRDRGQKSAWFGELSPNSNPDMPAALVEVAFHATASEAAWLAEPRFRMVAARAYTQAIIKYFATRDGHTPTLPPDPPTALRTTNTEGGIRVSWTAPVVDDQDLGGDAATGYMLYRSADGRAFDGGTEITGGATSILLTDLSPGELLFVKVAATNAGGESLPTAVLPAIAACPEAAAPALLVMGFYRLDAASAPVDDLGLWGLGDVIRLRQRSMNTYDYLALWTDALAQRGLALDSAEAAAVEAGAIPVNDYQLIAWQLGEESTVDTTLSPTEQAALRSWATGVNDGALVISGAELGWDLAAKGDDDDVAFLDEVLGVAYASDDAGTYALSSEALGPLTLDDGTQGTYNVAYPDVLVPTRGGAAVLDYGDGDAAAGIRHLGEGYTAFTYGLPLEAIVEPHARDALMAAAIEATGLTSNAPLCAPTPVDTTDTSEPRPEPRADAESGEDIGPAPETEGMSPSVAPVSRTTRTRSKTTGCTGGPTPWRHTLFGLLFAVWALCGRTRRWAR